MLSMANKKKFKKPNSKSIRLVPMYNIELNNVNGIFLYKLKN